MNLAIVEAAEAGGLDDRLQLQKRNRAMVIVSFEGKLEAEAIHGSDRQEECT